MPLHLVGETLQKTKSHYMAETGKFVQLMRGIYVDATDDIDQTVLAHAVRIGRYLYPNAYLSAASAVLLGPTHDGRLYLTGQRVQRTRIRALEIVQNKAPTKPSIASATVADSMGEFSVNVSSIRQRFLEAFRLRSEHAASIDAATRASIAARLVEEYGNPQAASDAVWALARENDWYREGERAEKFLLRNPAVAPVRNKAAFDLTVAWHGLPIGKLGHDGFEWRWSPIDTGTTMPQVIRQTMPGKLPPFVVSLLPEGWLEAVLHDRDERATLRSGRRYMSNITVAENTVELAALPLDVLTTPLTDHTVAGLFTGTYAGPGRSAIEQDFERNLAAIYARADTPRLSGVQIKAPMTLGPDGKLSPSIATPFTHILKPAGTGGFAQQLLTDGKVVVQINEGLAPEIEAIAKAKQTVTRPAPVAPAAERKFEVRHYEVVGNTLLATNTIDPILNQATGTNVTFSLMQKALGELQLAYRERGFASANVFLPQQQITNATVTVQVTEGQLVDVRVTGNRYFSSNNVMRALPTVREALIWKDQVVNSRVLQRELDIANQNRDRQIYPTITPGPEPGSSALNLKVKDRLPLHGRMDVDNYSTPGTPDWRINAAAQYNNLWQLEHQVGLSYGFTPEELKSDGLIADYFFNRPLISNYGTYYRIPFGSAESVETQVNTSTRFGYDEATHQFRLPPAGSRPDLTLFASASSSDTGVQYGRATTISQTPLLTIVSQDSGQNLSIDESLGGRLNVPLALSDTKRLNFSGGADWKYYELKSFNTNNFIITTVVTNSQGSQTIESRVSSPQPTRRNSVDYLPLAFGLDFSETDKHGSFSASVGFSYNFTGDSTNFSALAYSPDAEAHFGKGTLALTRDQKLWADWSLLLRANGQAATGPLISNEQFPLGGVNSVRGYYEGDEYGDSGWFGSAEVRTPFITGRVPVGSGFAPVWLRGSVFVDVGQRFLMDSDTASPGSRTLWGAGFGISANINNHVDARLTVGWPMADSANTDAGDPRAYFSLGGQF